MSNGTAVKSPPAAKLNGKATREDVKEVVIQVTPAFVKSMLEAGVEDEATLVKLRDAIMKEAREVLVRFPENRSALTAVALIESDSIKAAADALGIKGPTVVQYCKGSVNKKSGKRRVASLAYCAWQYARYVNPGKGRRAVQEPGTEYAEI